MSQLYLLYLFYHKEPFCWNDTFWPKFISHTVTYESIVKVENISSWIGTKMSMSTLHSQSTGYKFVHLNEKAIQLVVFNTVFQLKYKRLIPRSKYKTILQSVTVPGFAVKSYDNLDFIIRNKKLYLIKYYSAFKPFGSIEKCTSKHWLYTEWIHSMIIQCVLNDPTTVLRAHFTLNSTIYLLLLFKRPKKRLTQFIYLILLHFKRLAAEFSHSTRLCASSAAASWWHHIRKCHSLRPTKSTALYTFPEIRNDYVFE